MQWQTIEIINKLSPKPPGEGTWIRTDRAKVVGGWLVRTMLLQREVAAAPNVAPEFESSSSVAMTFVPDPSWTWVP